MKGSVVGKINAKQKFDGSHLVISVEKIWSLWSQDQKSNLPPCNGDLGFLHKVKKNFIFYVCSSEDVCLNLGSASKKEVKKKLWNSAFPTYIPTKYETLILIKVILLVTCLFE